MLAYANVERLCCLSTRGCNCVQEDDLAKPPKIMLYDAGYIMRIEPPAYGELEAARCGVKIVTGFLSGSANYVFANLGLLCACSW